MEHEYLVGRDFRGKGVCSLEILLGVDDPEELDQGFSRKKGWPDDARFEMDPNAPKDMKLEDFLQNGSSFCVVSTRFKELVEKEKPPRVEYLPVSIINHKGRKEKAQYWILHSTPMVKNAIDLKKTKAKRNNINPDVFSSVSNLTLDKKKIPPDLQLFRLEEFSLIALFRSDLAEKIQDAGMTGIEFLPPETWTVL